MSDWSKPVGTPQGQTIRVRMLIAQGRGACFDGPWPETEFYLDLQNISCAHGPMQIYFDPSEQLHCTLLDANGKSPHGGSGSGGGAGSAWISLPYDSTIRLRANMFGYGNKPGDGLRLCLWPPAQDWNIAASDTNIYCLSGTFTVTNHIPKDFTVTGLMTPEQMRLQEVEWSGTIELPKMRISLVKP